MAFALPKPQACDDCGGDALFHQVTYFSILIEESLEGYMPLSRMPRFILRFVEGLEHLLGPGLLLGTVRLGWAKRINAPDADTQLLAMCLWEEARARGIEMWEWRLFNLPRNIFMATYPNGKRIVFEGIPWHPRGMTHAPWTDNKARLKEEFRKRDLQVAKGGSAKNAKQALALYRSLTPPVIVKPHSGSGSRHTILHIMDEQELLRAFAVAKRASPQVIVEEELTGPVYRATVVEGKFIAAIRRDPPSVLGDGVHTILELVEEENKKPGRSGPYYSKIQYPEGKASAEAEKELAWQGYTGTSIPAQGTRVHFHQKVNWSLGGTTVDVTDDVHPDNITLFEKAGTELTAPIVGIDYIIQDISRSWKEQPRSGILECNTMPFFDNHHLPFEGKPRNVAAAIWDMVTPKNL
jgi:D-alanine-D-alanine ligase-like ATP-grasp enzyme